MDEATATNRVFETYTKNISSLSPEKQFHFASRLSLYNNNEWGREHVKYLREWFFEHNSIGRLAEMRRTLPDPIHINHWQSRQPFFDDYPWLYSYELQLFQALHSSVQYNVDIRTMLDSHDEVIARLVQDPRALGSLSTYLVNIFYLSHRFLQENDKPLIPLECINQALNLSAQPLKLSLYLLTHCIIGESLFYSRKIPANKRQYCDDIKQLLIAMLGSYWQSLTIDNKLEAALCLRMLDGSSHDFVSRAISEASQNFSETNGFIIDPFMPHKNNLEWAEHRNVLFLMLTMPAAS